MRTFSTILGVLLVGSAAAACSQDPPRSDARREDGSAQASERKPAPADAAEINPRLLRRFKTLPTSFGSEPRSRAQVDLGRTLFFDPRLSRGGDIACATCHDLDAYGVDRRTTAVGHLQQRGTRNTPTVFNAAGSFCQFWDGRAPNLEEQAKGPILNPLEMAVRAPEDVVQTLRAIHGYAPLFAEAFPGERDPITFDNVGRAIAAFERGLVTPSRWDRYLAGDRDALTRPEREGLRVFLNVGCMVCHTGPLLGGSMFEKVGVVEPWPNQTDTGRASITHAPNDQMMFKVPTLRNVAETAPYFHDGSAATLEDAVRAMGRHQLGLELTEAEISAICTWLRSLTGEVPKDYVRKPRLPT
jgi:cytochrome c peroxidase